MCLCIFVFFTVAPSSYLRWADQRLGGMALDAPGRFLKGESLKRLGKEGGKSQSLPCRLQNAPTGRFLGEGEGAVLCPVREALDRRHAGIDAARRENPCLLPPEPGGTPRAAAVRPGLWCRLWCAEFTKHPSPRQDIKKAQSEPGPRERK